MSPALEEIIAKAKADPDFTQKLLSATTEEEIVQAVNSLGLEVIDDEATDSPSLTDAELTGVAGGAARMSVWELVYQVRHAAFERTGDIGILNMNMDTCAKAIKGLNSSARVTLRNLD